MMPSLDRGHLLVGSTGFVGTNLQKYHKFDTLVNSSNIETIAGKSFDFVVVAAPSAEKWRVNQNDIAAMDDMRNIVSLIEILRTIEVTRNLVLVSTIDASFYHPYGINRAFFEYEVLEHVNNSRAVRLPALYGGGLKKNLIYDLSNGRSDMLATVNPESTFQFVNIEYACDIILSYGEEGIREIITEPVAAQEVASIFNTVLPGNDWKKVSYNIDPGPDEYDFTKQEVLDDIKEYYGRV